MPLPIAIVAAIVAAAASAAGAGASAITTGVVNRKARKQQDKQNEFNVEQRDYMNWYNSPANQMSRFKQAGLNPHLIYGKGSPGNQSAAPSAVKRDIKAPKLDFQSVGGAIGKYMETKKAQADIDLSDQHRIAYGLDNYYKSNSMITRLNTDKQKLKKEAANATGAEHKRDVAKLQIQNQEDINKVSKWKANLADQNMSPSDNLAFRQGMGLYNQYGKKVKGWLGLDEENKPSLPKNRPTNNQ